MAEREIAKDEAFGVVPILRQDAQYKFLLIQHHAGHWGFPKGHADVGETPLQSARREFTEETGIANYALLEGVKFSEQYSFTRDGKRFDKTVVYFPAIVSSPEVSFQAEEIQNYAWLKFEAAIARLTFEGAKRVLAEVHQYLISNG